ncbi:hypothetical protein CMV_020821 [Castanea mollissima]|uniref:Uncharacterized protein n=1 Tax=Castanea mollissima TaxID=60419 RepID=A0A8J4QVW5_9ROSI|nr:hypothetical protein CMV_020821 [Castanea mollissima]
MGAQSWSRKPFPILRLIMKVLVPGTTEVCLEVRTVVQLIWYSRQYISCITRFKDYFIGYATGNNCGLSGLILSITYKGHIGLSVAVADND